MEQPNHMCSDSTPFDEEDLADKAQGEPVQLSLFLTLDGFEGPIDVLLSLARDQKVDLVHISILELAEQYLQFVQQAQLLNLEIAADYLVMAAWLAYLKSRLLLPKTEVEESLSSEEMAEALRFQLQRLEAMREVGKQLFKLPQLGNERYKRGMSEDVTDQLFPIYDLTLFELLKVYGNIKLRSTEMSLHIVPTKLFAVDEALDRLKSMIDSMPDWKTLVEFLPKGLHSTLLARSAVASTFVASLELAKEGYVELRQDKLFGPIFLRSRD
jgi:segregation and condensation protein A